MGFMSGFGRMLAGKPVFENEDSRTPQPETVEKPIQDNTQGGARDASGRKVIPQIDIEHLQCHRNGNSITVTAWVTNRCDLAIRLDDSTILGQRLQVHYELTPHQNHEIVLYRGPIAMNDHDHHAKLTFRIMSNTDEFEINYVSKFHRNPDATFQVDELHQEGGVRDI